MSDCAAQGNVLWLSWAAMGGLWELILKFELLGDVFPNAGQEEAFALLRHPKVGCDEIFLLHDIAGIVKSFDLLIEEPAVIRRNHATDVLDEQVLGLHLFECTKELLVEEVVVVGLEIASVFLTGGAAAGAHAESGAGVATDEDISFGEILDFADVGLMEIDIREKVLVDGGCGPVHIVSPENLDPCLLRPPVEAATAGKQRHSRDFLIQGRGLDSHDTCCIISR